MATRKTRPRKTRTSTASRRAPKSRVGRATAQAQAAQEQLRHGVQQVWLAGMGAFARAQKEGPAAFQEAVAEGLKLLGQSQSNARQRMRDVFETAQETLQSRVGGARNQAQETWDNLETLFQSRVQRAMHQLGVPTAEEIRILTRRVTELNDSVRRIDAGDGRKGKVAKRKAAKRGGRRTQRTRAAG